MTLTIDTSALMTTALAVALAFMPFVVIGALLRVADRVTKRRDARYARQIELTDAIHRELGAIVAPTVRRRRGGGWLVSMTVPLDSQGTIPTILRITEERFGPDARWERAPYEVVFARPAADIRRPAAGAARPADGTPARLAA